VPPWFQLDKAQVLISLRPVHWAVLKLAVSERGARAVLSAVVLAAAGLLLFARLGHYALWDDEALTALSAEGILATGDTTAMVGHNLAAYRGGLCLRGLHDRSTPPLPAYLTAASFALFGKGPWAARLPFALCGLACVSLILWWLYKTDTDWWTWTTASLALIGNVSLFLYARQCRYYAVAILASVVIAFLYLRRDGRRASLWWLALWSCVLFAANYLNYVVLYGCLALDYLVWGRRRQPLKSSDWLVLLAPQILICGMIAIVWNPFQTGISSAYSTTLPLHRLKLFWWNFRDLNTCEFGVGLLLLAGAVLALLPRGEWLRRATLGLLAFVALETLLSPQPVDESTRVADVRYIAPVIPLCIAIGVLAIRAATAKARWLALPLALAAFGTNLLHGGPWLPGGLRSSLAAYAGELRHPPGDPFMAAAAWINANVREFQSVLVEPAFMMYPLMFHAPKPIYAWQLDSPPRGQFANLAPIHFKLAEPPEFIVGFGPFAGRAMTAIRGWNPSLSYQQVATLDQFWMCVYRPELFWRSFKPIENFDREREAIYIFRRRL